MSSKAQGIFGACYDDLVEQTRFIGLSVISFDMNTGWGGNPSTCSVALVQDVCNNDVFDESTIQNKIGTPFLFQMGQTQFGGVLKGLTRGSEEDGRVLWNATLQTPDEFLDDVYLILSDYYGEATVPNIFNLNLDIEKEKAANGGIHNPTILIKINGSMYYHEVIRSFNRLCNVQQEGITFKNRRYLVDISELPGCPNCPVDFYHDANGNRVTAATLLVSYRVQGNGITLKEFISQTCEDFRLDFFFELIFADTGELYIKLRTTPKSRNEKTDFQMIQKTVKNLNDLEVSVNSNQRGVEAIKDTCNVLMRGGVKEVIVVTDQFGMYFGTDRNNNPQVMNAEGYVALDTYSLQTRLQFLNIPDKITLSEMEIRGAMGEEDCFWPICMYGRLDIYRHCIAPLGPGTRRRMVYRDISGSSKSAYGCIASDLVGCPGRIEVDDIHLARIIADYQTIVHWVKQKGEQYYGRAYVTPFLYIPSQIHSETGERIYSHVPQEEGFREPMVTPTSLLGLRKKNMYESGRGLEGFTTETGKTQSFFVFANQMNPQTRIEAAIDCNEFNIHDFVLPIYNNYLYYRTGSIEWIKNGNLVLMNLSSPVCHHESDVILPYIAGGSLYPLALSQMDIENYYKMSNNIGFGHVFSKIKPAALRPMAACYGARCNRMHYGPWRLMKGTGPAKYIEDDSLQPWTYGSMFGSTNEAHNKMHSVAFARIAQEISISPNADVDENGSITIGGYPNLSLGDEIETLTDPKDVIPFGSCRVIPFITMYGFAQGSSVWGEFSYPTVNRPPLRGNRGPCVTRLSIQSGDDGVVRTTYSMNKYIPKAGFLAKHFIDRISLGVGAKRAAAEDYKRLYTIMIDKFEEARRGFIDRINDMTANKRNAMNTPSNVFRGQAIAMLNGLIRNICYSGSGYNSDTTDGIANYQKYLDQAFMSMDGLVRPFATRKLQGENSGTETNLSCFVIPEDEEASESPEAMGPVYSAPNESSQIPGSPINILTTNPLINPLDVDSNKLMTSKIAAGSKLGHDFEMIARGDIPPLEYNTKMSPEYPYNLSYRGMALRGPLVLQGWGRDLDGFPVPSGKDENGKDGDPKTYAKEWTHRSHLWKTGTVDLRWDETRGMWVPPSGTRVVCCVMETNMDLHDIPGSSEKRIMGWAKIMDCSENTTGCYIPIDSLGDSFYVIGDTLLAKYNPLTKRYFPISTGITLHGGLVTEPVSRKKGKARCEQTNIEHENLQCWLLEDGEEIGIDTYVIWINVNGINHVFGKRCHSGGY